LYPKHIFTSAPSQPDLTNSQTVTAQVTRNPILSAEPMVLANGAKACE
jgi:hypothetical protein